MKIIGREDAVLVGETLRLRPMQVSQGLSPRNLPPQIFLFSGSWKQLYFERNLEDTLEKFDPLGRQPHSS